MLGQLLSKLGGRLWIVAAVPLVAAAAGIGVLSNAGEGDDVYTAYRCVDADGRVWSSLANPRVYEPGTATHTILWVELDGPGSMQGRMTKDEAAARGVTPDQVKSVCVPDGTFTPDHCEPELVAKGGCLK